MTLQTADWTIDRIRRHIGEHLPLSEQFGLEIGNVTQDICELTITETSFSSRPGGTVAGPILFTAADIGSYALIICACRDPDAVTVDKTIHFLRPPVSLPLVAQTSALRIGRKLTTAETRIYAPDAPERLLAIAISSWALS